jgi:FKBP-type peptidyl-prolyl cis-trans isomerase FkpA
MNLTKPTVTSLLATLLLAACTAHDRPAQNGSDATPKIDLASDRARASYMVGVDIAKDLQPIRDDIDLDIVQQSMRATLSGQEPQLDAKQLDKVRREFTAQLREKRATQAREIAERNRRSGEAFLAANTGKPGVVTTPSGLQYQILRHGSGSHPAASATVSIHYIGRTLDGGEFSNTYAAQHPETLPLPRVMPGLSEAITLMTPGSRYRFWIPGPLAYGEAGRAGDIEPNATLVFDIELLEATGADTE